MEKIKQLIEEGTLSIGEILEYAQWYERQADEYYANMEYGDWECSEGTLHSHDQECDCPNYKEECYPQEYIDEMNARLNEEEEMNYYPMHSPNPIYIVASTLRYLEETLIFESDETGFISCRDDYGGIAQRWTPDIDWTDSDLAVIKVFGEGVFERISDVTPHEKGYFVRYMRINNIN